MPVLNEAGLKVVLGKDYEPGVHYVVSTHRQVVNKLNEGYEAVGEIKDSSSDPMGTMVIMRPAKKKSEAVEVQATPTPTPIRLPPVEAAQVAAIEAVVEVPVEAPVVRKKKTPRSNRPE